MELQKPEKGVWPCWSAAAALLECQSWSPMYASLLQDRSLVPEHSCLVNCIVVLERSRCSHRCSFWRWLSCLSDGQPEKFKKGGGSKSSGACA